MIAFLKTNARWIGGGFLLTFASSFGQTFFVSASVAEWQARFNLSHGEFGRLYMLATLASAAVLPFLGRIVDVWPPHRVIGVVVPLLAAACLTVAYAPSVLLLGIGIFALRLFGQGMCTHTAHTSIGRWYAAQRGRAVSLVVPGHQAGEALLPAAAMAITLAVGWQAVWVGGAVGLLVVVMPLLIWAFRVPRIPQGQAPTGIDESDRQWTQREVLGDPLFWLVLVGVLAPPFIGTTIFFHQDYLTALRAWPEGLFALGFPIMAATTVLCGLVTGAAVDRFGAIRVLPFFLIPLGGACFMVGMIAQPWGLVAFMLTLGVSYGISSTLFGALWPEIYGTANLGAVRSVAVSAMVFATAAGPGLTGTLIDRGIGLPDQMIAMGFYCTLAVVALSFASRALIRRGRQ